MSNTGRSHRRRVIALAKHQNDLCFHCGKPMVFLDASRNYRDAEGNEPDVASLHHVESIREGGSRGLWNVVVTHRRCNQDMVIEVINDGEIDPSGYPKPTQETYDRLLALNVKRGFGGYVPGIMVPDTFGSTSPASTFLCDLANAVPGKEGVRLRQRISEKINSALRDQKRLKDIEPAFAHQVLLLLQKEKKETGKPIGAPYDTLVENVIRTNMKIALQKSKKISLP